MSTRKPRSFTEIDQLVPLNIFMNVTDRYQLCHMHNEKDLSFAFILKLSSYDIQNDDIIFKDVELVVITNFNNQDSNAHLEFCANNHIVPKNSEQNNAYHAPFKPSNYIVNLKFNDKNNLNDTIVIPEIKFKTDDLSVFHFDVKILDKNCNQNNLASTLDMTAGTQICMNSVGKK